MIKPLFSICHTTARPGAWDRSYDAWLTNALSPSFVEYVLCVDERWGFKEEPKLRPVDKVVWNDGRRCSVDGWNKAADASMGDVLIMSSDDLFPAIAWDTSIIAEMVHAGKSCVDDFVVEVSSGKGADARRLMVCQILSRGRYDRLGYALYRRYESLRVDVDFTEHARHDGVVLDCRQLRIEHRHPAEGFGQTDQVYEHENRRESFLMGEEILKKRRACGFSS